jgi:hypothetical protein
LNGYQRAQALALTGTPAAIVAALKAIPLHHRNVYITGGPADTESVNLLHLLTARHRVMTMGANQEWNGSLITLETSDAGVAQIMSLLRPHLQVNDAMVYCAASEDAATMLNALSSVVGTLTGKAQQVIDEVKLLSGGRIGADYASLTVEQYNAQKAEAEAESAKESLRTQLQTLRQSFDAKCNVALENISLGSITDYAGLVSAVQVGG